MSIYDRCKREARPTMCDLEGRLSYCWLDYFRVVRATYPWWMRPFVRGRCSIAALILEGMGRANTPADAGRE